MKFDCEINKGQTKVLERFGNWSKASLRTKIKCDCFHESDTFVPSVALSKWTVSNNNINITCEEVILEVVCVQH